MVFNTNVVNFEKKEHKVYVNFNNLNTLVGHMKISCQSLFSSELNRNFALLFNE